MIAALGVGSLPNRRRRSLSRRVVCNSAPRCLLNAPSSEVVVVGGLPRQEEVVRKQPPGAPSPEHIEEDGVQELARLMSSGASARLGFGHERFEDTPFVIGEVCGVGSTGRHGTAAPSRFGSRILRALTPSQTPSNGIEKLSEKPRRRLQRCPGGRQRGVVGSISASVYQPYSRSERSSYPFSDSFYELG